MADTTVYGNISIQGLTLERLARAVAGRELEIDGPLVIGTDPGGSQLLRVGGAVRVNGNLVLSSDNEIQSVASVNNALILDSSGNATWKSRSTVTISADIDASGTGNLNLHTNNQQRLRVENNGNIVIGTDPGGAARLRLGGDMRLGGGARVLELRHTGTGAHAITLDANPTTAGASLGTVGGRWNGGPVGRVQIRTGADTTNKDDGRVVIQTQASDAGGLVDRLTVFEDGRVLVAGEIELDGALNHDGTTVGFYGVTPVVRPALSTMNYTGDAPLNEPDGTLGDPPASFDREWLREFAAEVEQSLNAIRSVLEGCGLAS